MKALFIDTGNLYYCVKQDFGKEGELVPKLNYERYLEDCGHILRTTAYVNQQTNEARAFIDYLTSLKIETKVHTAKSTNFNPSGWMALDVLTMESRLDEVIIGSSDRSNMPLVQWLKNRGITVTIFATGIPFHLQAEADNIIKITEAHLDA